MKQILLFILFPFILFGQTQIGLDIDGEMTNDNSGSSISLSFDGSIVAIGAWNNDGNGSQSGHVRVYENISEVWTQLGNDIDGEAIGDRSGWSVSLSSNGSIVAIGAWLNDGNGDQTGHVRVYSWDGSSWSQLGNDIDGDLGYNYSGWSVSLSSNGSIVAISDRLNNGNGADSGHVRVYSWDGSSWSQLGSDVNGETASDQSGESVSISSDGSVVAISAKANDGNGTDSGHVRVYSWNGSTWTQIGNDIDGETAGDQTGDSVSLSSDGSIVAIGARNNDGNGTDSGHVRVYENILGVWTQLGNDIDGKAAGDESGTSVSLSFDGSIVAIGSPLNNDNFLKGQIRVFKWNGSVWTQIGSDIGGEGGLDSFGASVSLSSDGSIVAIGAPFNDGNGNDSGHVRMYDLSAELSSDSFVLSQFNLYPNPVKEHFTIKLHQGLELQKVNIYNSLGQLIRTTTKNIVRTTNFSQGIYFVEIETNQGKATKKIVVE